MKCNLCNRKCNSEREENRTGYCKMTWEVRVARAALHMWEEPCISGENGSGTVFFTGCSLQCVYCQNSDIAIGNRGKAVTIERLAEIFLELQEQGANNINLVTPTHYVPQIIEAIKKARENGLWLPIVYNTGTYETVETLRMLDGYVDVYLPDMKYMDKETSKMYSCAHDYFETAAAAIAEMFRQVGSPQFSAAGIMTKGMIVRHLMLPGHIQDSKNIIKYLFDTYGDDIFISIMNQYTPLPQVRDIEELNRKITEEEYEEVTDYAIGIGIENGFIQEGDTATESFIPDFGYQGV